MSEAEAWYVVKQENGHCTIAPASQVEDQTSEKVPNLEKWGPFDSQQEAIARRVGLIRAGKCQPA